MKRPHHLFLSRARRPVIVLSRTGFCSTSAMENRPSAKVAADEEHSTSRRRPPTVVEQLIANYNDSLTKPTIDAETKEFLIETLESLFFLKQKKTSTRMIDSLRTALILDVLMYKTCQTDEVLVKERELGHEMYIVHNGDLSVTIKGNVVRHLRRGATVGELALIYNEPRSATVTCLSPCTLFVLKRADFKRIQEITSSAANARRSEWMKSCPELNPLGSVELSRLVEVLEVEEFNKGHHIFDKGRLTNKIVLIEVGEVKIDFGPLVQSNTSSSAPALRSKRLESDILVRSTSRMADEDTVHMIAEKLPTLFEPSQTDSIRGFHSSEFVSQLHLPSEAAPVVPPHTVAEDEENPFLDDEIIGPGSVVGMGALLCKANIQDNKFGDWEWISASTNTTLLSTLSGRMLPSEEGIECGALCPFTLTVASETAVCSFFTIEAFEMIFGSANEVLPKLRECASQGRTYVASTTATKLDTEIDLMKFDESKFEQIQFISQGQFGYVTVSEYKDDHTIYILKRFSKTLVEDANRLPRLVDELKYLMELKNTYVAKLVGTYHCHDEVAFVLENCGAYDLWSYMYEGPYKEQEGIPLDTVRYFLACIIVGLGYLHSLGIAYRELKPESVRLKFPGGKITLFEFSNAKKIPYTVTLPNGNIKILTKSFTFCGTPEYLAPEYIYNSGIDHAVDLWALGIVAYEMVQLSTPFSAEGGDPTAVFSNIAQVSKNGVKIPPVLIKRTKGTQFVELLGKLLKVAPSSRLSYSERNTMKILKHDFFKSIDVEAIKAGTYRHPGIDNHELASSENSVALSYKNFSPEMKEFTGNQEKWLQFGEMS